MTLDDVLILLPALCAGILVLSTHVPLGREVLARGIIFIDLAVAQVIGFSVLLAVHLGLSPDHASVYLLSIASALSVTGFFYWIERTYPQRQEAIIGVTFVLAATASILLLSGSVSASEHLKELLVGQILWVTWDDLIFPALISVALMLVWFFVPLDKRRWVFYGVFAVAITLSMPLIGVYLVFASLIVPALMVDGVKHAQGNAMAFAGGVLGYIFGLGVSFVADLPSGAVIVWTLVAVSLLGRVWLKNCR